MNNDQTAYPIEPQRVIAFANFFKRYMSISSVVAAALPIPITQFKLIPTFSAHTRILSTYTPLFCFLALGFIFYIRHPLARLMFPDYLIRDRGQPSENGISSLRLGQHLMKYLVTFLPALLILASLSCIFFYHDTLDNSLDNVEGLDGEEKMAFTEIDGIFQGTKLIALYLGIFVFAEASFILMAIKEYLQDILGYSEADLIFGPKSF